MAAVYERYILIPEYEASNDMLNHECVAPYEKPISETVWNDLRRYTDNGVVKAVVKFKVCGGTPAPIAQYLENNNPPVYETPEELAAIIDEEMPA